MNKEKELFTSQQERLLSIAVWAKYLAWIVIIVYILSAGTQIFRYQSFLYYTPDFWGWLKNNPYDAFSLGVNMAVTALKGTVYFLVLKGVSLGLNMIVETDINYREQKEAR